uniref:Uncharacterized protein n=1 Tax=Chromera velia CCMP2878 TaxID=1169474 RepID=A0A0G4FHI8_9ALVE|eukprot:Cvel_17036.t1-p1 / transcript=Cvel_17036.t1 / gene=Cvel_17036 / organism=Chromera_velia_CCMP2878 / gene_product=hypothetical protein / transcript_product=hypothetical protein / location=Cvel_scaffold1340:43973-46352(+) / protein_length=107 / sequence_SO=supercontig / SO=protein_coding / is_pseudo=false
MTTSHHERVGFLHFLADGAYDSEVLGEEVVRQLHCCEGDGLPGSSPGSYRISIKTSVVGDVLGEITGRPFPLLKGEKGKRQAAGEGVTSKAGYLPIRLFNGNEGPLE